MDVGELLPADICRGIAGFGWATTVLLWFPLATPLTALTVVLDEGVGREACPPLLFVSEAAEPKAVIV